MLFARDKNAFYFQLTLNLGTLQDIQDFSNGIVIRVFEQKFAENGS